MGAGMEEEKKEYKAKYEAPDFLKDTGADYAHTKAHQAAYDFSIYIHNKMKSLPKYEKFTLQKEIRETIDVILDEIELYEVTKSVSHLYTSDRMKRRLMRKNKNVSRSEIFGNEYRRDVLLCEADRDHWFACRRPDRERKEETGFLKL